MSARPCPACGASGAVKDRVVRDADGRDVSFDVFVCGGCGCGFVDPVPGDLDDRYGGGFYAKRSTTTGLAQTVFLGWRAGVVARALGSKTRGRLLDVGSGGGEFLDAMAGAGFDVCGFEPSQAGRNKSSSVPVVASLDAVDGEFDVVTMWHALEHIPEPLPVLQQLKKRLKPGAPLVVAVPNAGSVEARVFGEGWFHLDVPRHLLQLTRPSLEQLLARAGFVVDDVVRFSPEYDVYGLLQSALNALPGAKNALYHRLKHGRSPNDIAGRAKLAASLALLPTLTPAAAVTSWALSRAGLNGTITAIARAANPA